MYCFAVVRDIPRLSVPLSPSSVTLTRCLYRLAIVHDVSTIVRGVLFSAILAVVRDALLSSTQPMRSAMGENMDAWTNPPRQPPICHHCFGVHYKDCPILAEKIRRSRERPLPVESELRLNCMEVAVNPKPTSEISLPAPGGIIAPVSTAPRALALLTK